MAEEKGHLIVLKTGLKVVPVKIYSSKTHSDEEGPHAEEGKHAILNTNRSDVHRPAAFLEQVKKHLEKNNSCHMHFRDSFPEWNRKDHIDIGINVE